MNKSHPPLKNWVLVRGLMRGVFHWKSFPSLLKKSFPEYNFYFVELPGNGKLFNEDSPIDPNAAIAALKKQLPADVTEYGLIGISLGGMLTTHWAQTHSEVKKLVLINSSSRLSPFYERLIPKNYLQILHSVLFASAQKTEEFILSTTCNREEIWKLQLNENTDFLKNHPLKFSNFIRQLILTTKVNFNLKPEIPILLLASESDRLVSFNCTHQIAFHWSLKAHLHPSAGHDLPNDEPLWVIEQIKNFLQS